MRGWALNTYRFGEFELRVGGGVLLQDGKEVSLQPQVLSLLIFLIENRDRIVSKDELIDALWDGRIVSDAALNTRIRDVRRALRDDGRDQRYVRTFPKRGVQFVADIEDEPDVYVPNNGRLDAPPELDPKRRNPFLSKWALAVLAVAAVLLGLFQILSPQRADPIADQPSIAVLKFASRPGSGPEFISEGVAENLITDLSKFRELFVISRNTSFTFEPDTTDARDLREELGVEFVVQGRVGTADGKVNITAELIDTETGELVWTERLERPLEDALSIQSELSVAIAGRLLPEMMRSRVASNRAKRTTNLSAWDLLLQARAHQVVFTPDGQARAISLAEAALDRDPEISAAHAVIAQAKGNLFFWSDGDLDTRDAAISAAQEALRIDPNDPLALAALGYVYRFTGEETRAIANLERAVELNPNNALIRLQFAHTLDWFRHQERALPEIELAISLSPRDPLLQNMLFYKAHILFHLERYEQALTATDRMGAVLSSGPWEVFYHLMRSAILAELGRVEEARTAIASATELSPGLTLTAMKARFDKSKNHPDNRAIWLASLEKAGLAD